MNCPHCGKAAHFEFRTLEVTRSTEGKNDGCAYEIRTACCPACEEYVVLIDYGLCKWEDSISSFFLTERYSSRVIFPQTSVRKAAVEAPPDFQSDFQEASAVLPISPKASAALSRRLLQRVLRDCFDVHESNLSQEIDSFIEKSGASSHLNQQLDAIRHIGNFAAHPLKSTSSGEIINVEPGEAEWLIEVLEDLFDFAFVKPKRLEERRAELNKKLEDLGKRTLK